MLSFDGGEDVFFDTVDYFSSEDSVIVKESLGYGKLGYDIWMCEPQSVKERRERFLCGMGFVEFTSLHEGLDMTGLQRILDQNGATSSSCGSSIDDEKEDSVCNISRELNGEANCMIDELDQGQFDELNVGPGEMKETICISPLVYQFGQSGSHNHVEECKSVDRNNKKMSWWKRFINKRKENQAMNVSEKLKPIAEAPSVSRMEVKQKKKRYMEFSAVYVGQEVHAHQGFIWTMKFSPDGQYLASGGEDGVVRIWHVTSAPPNCKSLFGRHNFSSKRKEGKFISGKKKSVHASVVIPDKVFQIEESPVQVFRGHTSDVLDLAWSNSNCLLSSSTDKTVRLWQVDRDECLNVFHHNGYVTCIQFNPVNQNYFISGSTDGKVRIWAVSEGRVADWADVRDAVTAICYQPNGKGFVVGSITGTCRFYETSGREIQLNAQIHIKGRKKSSTNKITSIQFSPEDIQRIMISSEDSKLRILDGIDVVHKYKGRSKSGSQMSASFTSTGTHIISVGEDSRVYVWNYDDPCMPSSKQTKSNRMCEHFFFEGLSVAIPWSATEAERKNSGCRSPRCCLQEQERQEASSLSMDSECFSLSNWFSTDGSSFRSSATWPEEKLAVPVAEHGLQHHNSHDHHHHQSCSHDCKVKSPTWGLAIVTAGWDGTIRTFHNYGLPVRI